jgi:hypothetical protein
MMLLTALLMLGSASAPVEARVVDIDLVRTTGPTTSWYNKVEVELASASGQSLRICPNDAAVVTQRAVGDELKSIGRYSAYAMKLSGVQQTAACRSLTLQPGQVQRVTFLIREVPGRWRGEDLYSFDLSAGNQQFRFVQPARPLS